MVSVTCKTQRDGERNSARSVNLTMTCSKRYEVLSFTAPLTDPPYFHNGIFRI
ncbi:hypothetical protein Mapa_011935 [Marchantia paleacea]|nr:hypothetical protein Mapa_011935 [Marchantia paleacea]